MLNGEKILVTGATGQVAAPIAEFLARTNEVWGAGRLKDDAARAKLQAKGIKPCALDLERADDAQIAALPRDFTYVLHFAFMRGGLGDFDRAIRVNGEGTGMILAHCKSAKAALVVSSAAIYTPQSDPAYPYAESSELGRSFAPWSPTSPVSKIAEEAVARFCARNFNLKTTIARLNTVYGRPENLPSMHIRAIQAGETVPVPFDPNLHSPIHVDDMCAQIEPLLAAASVPAQIVNWAGDEVISSQHWCAEAGRMVGKEAKLEVRELPGAQRSNVADVTRRRALTGPCQVKFADGFRKLFETYHAGGRA